jgi:AraC family transcriptional regulator of arabinose operon
MAYSGILDGLFNFFRYARPIKSGSEHGQRIREGFPKQRVSVLPASVVKRCESLPIVQLLHVTHIGAFPSAPHHYVERKRGANEAILIYCLKGRGEFELGGVKVEVTAGHAFVIPPGTPHGYRADEVEPWSIFWIHFKGTQLPALMKSLEVTRDSPLVYVPDVNLMREAFEEVYVCLNYHFSDGGLLAMSGELMRLFALLKLHQGHFHPQRQSLEQRIIDSMDFMVRHIDMPLTLAELSTRAGLSVTYYSKLFKGRNSVSPMSWFIARKVSKACELLTETDLSVQEIAMKLGYADPYYFSRIFKKIQGVAPANYRIQFAQPDPKYRGERSWGK